MGHTVDATLTVSDTMFCTQSVHTRMHEHFHTPHMHKHICCPCALFFKRVISVVVFVYKMHIFCLILSYMLGLAWGYCPLRPHYYLSHDHSFIPLCASLQVPLPLSASFCLMSMLNACLFFVFACVCLCAVYSVYVSMDRVSLSCTDKINVFW